MPKTRGMKQKIASLKRTQQILTIFARYGFGYLFTKLAHESKDHLNGVEEDEGVRFKRSSERLRLAIEELGPTFIKFGQILSTRCDLFPTEYIEELKKLQDKVAPLEYSVLESYLETLLPNPSKELFLEIDKNSIGSGSLAQVYKAQKVTGEWVVLKIKKPHVDEIVAQDIEIMRFLAHFFKTRVELFSGYDVVEIVEEFAVMMSNELNFITEAKNADKIRYTFRHHSYLKVPKVDWKLTSENLLVEEYIEGEKLENYSSWSIEKRSQLADIGASIFLKMILKDGVFHADLHPGNIFFLPNQIALVDYGNVGILSEEEQYWLANLIEAIVIKDGNKMVASLRELTRFPITIDERRLKQEMLSITIRYYDCSLGQVSMGKLLHEVVEAVARYKIIVPNTLLLLAKSFMMAEGVCRTLNPEFNMLRKVKPYIVKIMMKRYHPLKITREILEIAERYKTLIAQAPNDIQEIIQQIRRGKLGVDIRLMGLDRFRRSLDRIANRLAISLIIAALIIGSSLLMNRQGDGRLTETGWIGFVGYLIAALFGIVMIFHIFRKDKLRDKNE